jgi:dihydroneopterin aldolase
MNHILIEGLELFARHGVHEAERLHGQVFLLDLTLAFDAAQACQNDDLASTVNYSSVMDCAAAAFTGGAYQLIERAAQVTAEAVMAQFAPVQALTLRVHKPNAPVKQRVKDITFELRMRREAEA